MEKTINQLPHVRVAKSKEHTSQLRSILLIWITALLATCSLYYSWSGSPIPEADTGKLIQPFSDTSLQDIVTWDQHSVLVRGERIMIYSGEFHPYRLPVPGLWLDILQKIKALGFSAVSFYTNWALLEGREGSFTAEGIFALEPFFDAATEAGLYVIARPGPYINAESSGGGYPGWLNRKKAVMRTPDYLPDTANYVKNIASIIAKAQITNGGPVILLQPENEYSQATSETQFPNRQYFAAVRKQYIDAGIVVPLISNDGGPYGLFAPGTGLGAADIYGHDGYPLGFDCTNPSLWPGNLLPTNYNLLHQLQSPSTPFSIMEFQAGAFDPWGGSTFNNCAGLLNEEFERVFYKNNYAAGIKVFNLYMIYGGTNWGNSGHPGGYTSYDYGAAIAEDRTISRLKYHEIKLQASFLKASPTYLTAVPESSYNRSYINTDAIAITRLIGIRTSFYIVRHAMYNGLANTNYRLKLPTSIGNIDIPRLSDTLVLNGRDSRIHVTDYDIGGTNILYSTAEIFTWQKYADKTVLILYGGLSETHEIAFTNITLDQRHIWEQVEGEEINITTIGDTLVLNWVVTVRRKIVRVDGNIMIYLLDRTDAFNYWVLDLPRPAPFNNFTCVSATSIIARLSFQDDGGPIRPGYLLRTASYNPWFDQLSITGDLNETSILEIIGGIPQWCHRLNFNGNAVSLHRSSNGILEGFVPYLSPRFSMPNLSRLAWKYIDSLPEVLPAYDDSAWLRANLTSSNNTVRALTTPTSLYGSDYGFHTGNLLFRGRFMAAGIEKTLRIETQGGTAYAASVFLDRTLLGSFPGTSVQANSNLTFALPPLITGQECILTVLLDTMGLDQDFVVGSDTNKTPRGILNYALSGRAQSAIRWKLSGNLGGEHYRDRARGPLNEGGLSTERHGYHLPRPPSANWEARTPADGIAHVGVGFFTASFALHIPTEYVDQRVRYDIPMSFVFTNATRNGAPVKYRAQLYVNGYHFGKYVNNIGPQTAFPVPEGILDYHGMNYVALSLWAMEEGGAKIEIELVATAAIQTMYKEVEMAPVPGWERREGAY